MEKSLRSKYTKISKQGEKKENILPNEVRITAVGQSRKFIAYATSLFREKKRRNYCFKSNGFSNK